MRRIPEITVAFLPNLPEANFKPKVTHKPMHKKENKPETKEVVRILSRVMTALNPPAKLFMDKAIPRITDSERLIDFELSISASSGLRKTRKKLSAGRSAVLFAERFFEAAGYIFGRHKEQFYSDIQASVETIQEILLSANVLDMQYTKSRIEQKLEIMNIMPKQKRDRESLWRTIRRRFSK